MKGRGGEWGDASGEEEGESDGKADRGRGSKMKGCDKPKGKRARMQSSEGRRE